MAIKRTVQTTSTLIQIRMKWDLKDRIDSVLSEDEAFAAWVKDACEMRLAGNGQTKTPKKQPSDNSFNAARAEKVILKITETIDAMTTMQKSEILSARYPKNEFLKVSEISKDSVRKYWEKIEFLLCN